MLPLKPPLVLRESHVGGLILELFKNQTRQASPQMQQQLLCKHIRFCLPIVKAPAAHSSTQTTAASDVMDVASQCQQLCGRWLLHGSYCREQCLAGARHGGPHIFDCLHTLPPPRPSGHHLWINLFKRMRMGNMVAVRPLPGRRWWILYGIVRGRRC